MKVTKPKAAKKLPLKETRSGILIEEKSNRIRKFHFPVEITQIDNEFFLPLAYYYDDELEETGPQTAVFIRELAKVVGIDRIRINRHQLNLRIGKAFVWRNIEPEVLSVIHRNFNIQLQLKDLHQKYPSPNVVRTWYQGKTTNHTRASHPEVPKHHKKEPP